MLLFSRSTIERKRGKKEEREEAGQKCMRATSATFVLSLLFHLSMSL